MNMPACQFESLLNCHVRARCIRYRIRCCEKPEVLGLAVNQIPLHRGPVMRHNVLYFRCYVPGSTNQASSQTIQRSGESDGLTLHAHSADVNFGSTVFRHQHFLPVGCSHSLSACNFFYRAGHLAILHKAERLAEGDCRTISLAN
jgi:hypothetical protein